jgi:hypothetical protein
VNALIWRLHRNQAYIAIAAMAALTVLLLVTGSRMADDYHSALASCATTRTCNDLSSYLFRGDGAIIDTVNYTALFPLLLGVFWGAPLVSREYDEGTHNLAWVQGVTRRRWIATNMTWAIAAAVAWGAALAALVYWWRAPENALSARFDSFDIQGVVPIAYAVFAVMVGLALGSLIRRPIPAIGATMVTFVALRAAVGVYLRPHFMTPVTVSTSVTVRGAAISVRPEGIPDNAWVINQFFTGPRGEASGSLHDLGLSCHGLTGYVACLGRHGLHAVTTYQPDSRFWAFQGIESAIFVALAAICAGVAYLAVLHRDA